jgi:DNA-binding IscR family transcriptional regulator
VDELLDALVRAGLLARVVSGRDAGFVPGRDPEGIRAEDVRDALRREPRVDPLRAAVERRLGPGLRRAVRGAEEQRRRSPHNLTLRELAAAEAEDGPPPAGAPPERGEGDGDAAVVDEKQPDVPA